MLTVIQYYIQIKKTKTSRKDLKKGKNMINQKKDFNMITKKLETELSSFHFDGLEISEITPKTSWMKLHINVLFINGNAQITKVLYKDYETGLWYYIKNDGMIISHKDTFNHTIKNLIDEMIYDCHIEIEEAEETEATEETEETEKDVIEVKQELNARFGKEHHCTNQNTCCIVSPFVHCNYDYKSDSCIKAHKNFIHDCAQLHKQMKAKQNPEWHHGSLATLANIDTDNDYQHDCDLIKAKSFKEAFEYTIDYMGAGWPFTKIEIETVEENQYIIQYHDNYTNENDLFSCKADSELDAKIKFRLCNDFSDTKRYEIISVKGVTKCEE